MSTNKIIIAFCLFQSPYLCSSKALIINTITISTSKENDEIMFTIRYLYLQNTEIIRKLHFNYQHCHGQCNTSIYYLHNCTKFNSLSEIWIFSIHRPLRAVVFPISLMWRISKALISVCRISTAMFPCDRLVRFWARSLWNLRLHYQTSWNHVNSRFETVLLEQYNMVK